MKLYSTYIPLSDKKRGGELMYCVGKFLPIIINDDSNSVLFHTSQTRSRQIEGEHHWITFLKCHSKKVKKLKKISLF